MDRELKTLLSDGNNTGSVVRRWPVRAFVARRCNLRQVSIGVGFIALYVLLDRATGWFQSQNGVSAWYPPVGLAMAVLAGLDVAYAPLMLAAGFLADVVNDPRSSVSLSYWLWICAMTAAYAGGAVALRSLLRVNPELRSFRDVSWYLAVALTAAFGSALAETFSLPSETTLRLRDYPNAALNWWVGDAVALLCLTPFLLVHVIPRLRRNLALAATSPDPSIP